MNKMYDEKLNKEFCLTGSYDEWIEIADEKDKEKIEHFAEVHGLARIAEAAPNGDTEWDIRRKESRLIDKYAKRGIFVTPEKC